MRHIHYFLATAIWSGYVPKAPGTAGSAVGMLLAWFFLSHDSAALLIATAICFFVGWWSSDVVEKDLGMEDPSIVVIDEVAGMWLSLLLVPANFILYLLAFGLFRLFDIWKPWPIDSLQHLHGGLGIMLDDMLAGLYAFLVMQILLYFLPF